VKTGQKVNSLPDVQLPMQNCINVQCFVVHAAHGLKAYQVNFPMQPMTHHLDFPRWSYCQNTEDCAEDQQSRGNSLGIHFVEPLSHSLSYLFFISCFHLSRRAVPSINTPLLHKHSQTFDNRNTKPILFRCVLTNIERVISTPFALVISFAGLQKWWLHPLPIGAPTPFEVSSIDYRLCWLVP
jgi:hypothetical protein